MRASQIRWFEFHVQGLSGDHLLSRSSKRAWYIKASPGCACQDTAVTPLESVVVIRQYERYPADKIGSEGVLWGKAE